MHLSNIKITKNGLKKLKHDFKNVRQYKNIVRFLVASAIYRDGLVTLFAIGGVFAAQRYGLSFTEI